MHKSLHPDHQEPTRHEAATFYLKSRLLMVRRWWLDRSDPIPFHSRGGKLTQAPPLAKVSVPLWNQMTPAEFPLTAGKVQNLRAACRHLNGLEVPAGEVFSFWKQVGRTTRGKGFTTGRELRSGCLVPNLGGGLCQLSGLLHAAALKAGLEVVERHRHSRTLPGTPTPDTHDATLFWNYVDLQFRSTFPWRLNSYLTSSELVVVIRATSASAPDPTTTKQKRLVDSGAPTRSAAEGDCLTCGVSSCFRHPSANRDHAPAAGHTAWLLEGYWPEFGDWCQLHTRPGDRWLTPLDGHRWHKPNYAWSPPANVSAAHATWETLHRSWQQRRLPVQGAARQGFLLDGQQRLADYFARRLDPQARHVVVSQTLLPHLWRMGHLGGRTFDVLVQRWPLAELQWHLDAAAARHPQSETLADFRADPELVAAETEALAAAARLVTPHRAIAKLFGARSILLDWAVPTFDVTPAVALPTTPSWFFPASALARKGIYDLATAVATVGGELRVLGRARETHDDPLAKLPYRQATLADLPTSTALLMPAWIEHEPRLLLRALAVGIPVIASRSCGLSPHPLLTEVDAGDVSALTTAMQQVSAQRHSTLATAGSLS